MHFSVENDTQYLSLFELLQQKYHGWLKQQTLISHSSGGWEVQDEGAGIFGVL